MTMQEFVDAIKPADDGDTVFVDSTSKVELGKIAASRMNKAIKLRGQKPPGPRSDTRPGQRKAVTGPRMTLKDFISLLDGKTLDVGQIWPSGDSRETQVCRDPEALSR